MLAAIGPTFITAALMFGPGSITLASTAGSRFGYQLLWVPIVATVLMIVFCDLAVRIGLGSGLGTHEVFRKRFGPVLAVVAALTAFLVCSSFQAGNSMGTGIAASIALPGDTRWYAVAFTLLGVAMVWARKFYPLLESTMTWVVVVMLAIFVVTMIVSKPSVGAIAAGLIPSLPAGSQAVVVAMVATTFSVVGAMFQIQLAKQKGWTRENYAMARSGVVAGILILGLLSLLVMVTAASVLRPAGVTVTSPADLAGVLRPIAGDWAAWLFAIGLWGAAFTSMIGNGTIGGSMLSAAFGWGQSMDTTRVKAAITFVLLLGGLVAVMFGKVPLELITTAQAATIFGVPIIGVMMLVLARSRLLGNLRTSWPQFAVCCLGVAFLVYLAFTYAKGLLA